MDTYVIDIFCRLVTGFPVRKVSGVRTLPPGSFPSLSLYQPISCA
jgi:hypothetical protein